MNKMKLASLHCLRVIQLLIFGLALQIFASAGAQNLLKNGDFEQPLGAANWTLGYLCGGRDDFEIQDRSRGGARMEGWRSPGFGGYFRPLSVLTPHAYFTQVATNLTPKHVYTVSGWMREDYWRGPRAAFRDKFLVYIEAIGGKGTPTADGRASLLAKTPPDPNIDAPYTYPTGIWRKFTVEQTPDANGKIEVRLHYNKVGFTIYDKTWISAGSFDDISLTP
jgi:hypothetical protein